MTTHVEKIRRQPTASGGLYEKREVTTTGANQVDGQTLGARVVWYLAGILLVLLGFRFVLSLLGANTTNGFASFIYSTSHPFVAPFFSLFSYNYRYGVSRFEIYTLAAMLVYMVIAWGIVSLITLNRR